MRPHILLLNKMDIADTTSKDTVRELYRRQGVDNVMYVNCTGDSYHVKKKVRIKKKKVLSLGKVDRFDDDERLSWHSCACALHTVHDTFKSR